MPLLARTWLALSAVIATVLAVLSVLLVMQHDAVLSQFIRQRIGVTLEATAAPFRSIVELGLPITMVRNASQLLDRAAEVDPAVTAIHVFNPTGITVRSVGAVSLERIPEEIVAAQQAAGRTGRWSVETTDGISASSTTPAPRTPWQKSTSSGRCPERWASTLPPCPSILARTARRPSSRPSRRSGR